LSSQICPKEPSGRKFFHIGKIGRAQGLAGEVRVFLLSSDPERLSAIADCLLFSANEKESHPVQIEYARPARGQLAVVKLRGIDDRSQAEKLTGGYLSVEREKALVLQPDEWFVCDLIGCKVYDQAWGYLGTIRDILQNRSQDVYVVAQSGQPDLLFPAMKSILLKVDVENQRMETRLPDGLYEVYRGKES
jgi:16S rRNA processing protein RimM